MQIQMTIKDNLKLILQSQKKIISATANADMEQIKFILGNETLKRIFYLKTILF